MTAPHPHQTAALLLAHMAREVPTSPNGWPDNRAEGTKGRPECETLLNFAKVHFTPKPAHDVAPGDVLVFRVTDVEAARTAGVMGDGNFFTYEIPGRDGLQTAYLGHFWRTRLAAAFSVPEAFLDNVKGAVRLAAE